MPMTFDEFMERYNAQGGPLPSAWSPEAQQAYAEKQNTMGIAEFRPINKREQKLINFARLLDYLKRAPDGARQDTNRFVKRHLKKLSKIQEKAQEKGTDLEEMIADKIKKDFPPEAWTPQIEENLPYNTMNDVYPSSSGKWGKLSAQIPEEERLQNISTRKLIDDNIQRIVDEDFASVGYPKESIEWANELSREQSGENRLGRWKWGTMNEQITGKIPEHVYHKTTKEKLGSIAQEGLKPPEQLPIDEVNWPNFPEQMDKVFFGDKYDTGVGMNVRGSHSTLRTKFSEDMNPDIHSPRSFGWWQTQKPVPPTALEIESAPGQWEPLLEYIRKRGNK